MTTIAINIITQKFIGAGANVEGTAVLELGIVFCILLGLLVVFIPINACLPNNQADSILCIPVYKVYIFLSRMLGVEITFNFIEIINKNNKKII